MDGIQPFSNNPPTIGIAPRIEESAPVTIQSGDTITPPPASGTSLGSSIISGVQCSIDNLCGWASYIAKNSASRFFPPVPGRINRENFSVLIDVDTKTPLEIMAALNEIICSDADYPDYQKDVLLLIEKIAQKIPNEFRQFCLLMGITDHHRAGADFPSLLAIITADPPAAFTKMKEVMVNFYCAPFQSMINTLSTNIHIVDKLLVFCSLLASKEFIETLRALDKQPMAKQVIQKIVTDSIPHIEQLGDFMIECDAMLSEDKRFGLHAIATAEPATVTDIFTKWVMSDSFSLYALNKYSIEFKVTQLGILSCDLRAPAELKLAALAMQKLTLLDFSLDHLPSNNMVVLIIDFTQMGEDAVINKIISQHFETLVRAMISVDDPSNPIIPIGIRTTDQIKNWLIREEKVDEYAPKVALLRKGIQKGIAEYRQEMQNAIDPKNWFKRFINDVQRGRRTESHISEDLLLATKDPALPEEALSVMFNVVAKEYPSLFSKIAQSVIDKQTNSPNHAFALIAQQLQQNVTNNQYSSASLAAYITSGPVGWIRTVLLGDPLDDFKSTGADELMDNYARYIEFKKYTDSSTFNREFIATGLSIHLA